MESWVNEKDTEVSIAVWSPQYDPIIYWEQVQAGLIADDWVKLTCSTAAGVGLRFSHSIARMGAICMLKKSTVQIEAWSLRWQARFGTQWAEKAQEVRLGDWKALLVCGDEGGVRNSPDRYHRLCRAIEDAKFDRLPDQFTRLNWDEVEQVLNDQ